MKVHGLPDSGLRTRAIVCTGLRQGSRRLPANLAGVAVFHETGFRRRVLVKGSKPHLGVIRLPFGLGPR